MSLGTQEQRTEGIRKQASELIEQAYQRGFKAGYSKAENDYHAKTEDDRQSSYELGLNEAWEAARKIVEYGRIKCDVILGDGVVPIENRVDPFIRLTAAEAISKIKAYEEQKKQNEDEIKVGDEVLINENAISSFPNAKAIVTMIDDTSCPYNVIFANGDTEWVEKDEIHKTGRHFPEIVEVLKKLKEDDK